MPSKKQSKQTAPGLKPSGPASASPCQSTAPDLSPEWASDMQGSMGNSAIQAQLQGDPGPDQGLSPAPLGPVGDKIPKDFSVENAGISFRLPGETDLTGNWNQLCTTSGTTVCFRVSSKGFEIDFWPPLLVDMQWPVSNVEWSGVTYDFTKGQLTHVALANSQFAIPASGKVRAAIEDFIQGIVAGTPLQKAGYDPLQDPDLGATLGSLQRNFQGKSSPGGKKGDLKPEDVGNFSAFASIKLNKAIDVGAGEGGISLPAGAGISISADVAGNAATLPGGGVPDINGVDISSTDMILKKGKDPVAKLKSVRIDRGGLVRVRDFESMGNLRTAEGAESLVKLLFVLAAVSGGGGGNLNGADISPTAVDKIAMDEMNKGLTEAFQSLVRQHWNAVPGVDLRAILGVAPETKTEEKPKDNS